MRKKIKDIEKQYIVTLKDSHGWYDHVVIDPNKIINSLLWCKQTLPDIWQELQTVPDDIIKNMSLRSLIETYYKSEIICISDLKEVI